MMTTDTVEGDLVGDLKRAQQRYDETQSRMAEFGREDLEALADVYRTFTALLDRYEEQVVGDAGDYRTNIEFQNEIATVINDTSSDVLLYETFTECAKHLRKKYYKTAHFDHVREQLEPVGDIVERLDDYEEAREEYREARRAIVYRVRDLDEDIANLERLSRLGKADLDAPTERLREPITAYNETVSDALQTFRSERSAREIIEFLDAMEAYPLVPFQPPPEELGSFLREEPPGEETISKLLDYATYSRSKLDHYVEDPDRLKHVVGGQRTYLSGLDAQPLRIEWPPPSARELQWRCRELRAAVNRFAPDAVEQLRTVEALPRETDYERLRTSIRAREELTDQERKHIKSGSIEEELAEAREERQLLEDVLDEYPER